MEWIVEGLVLDSIGALVTVVTATDLKLAVSGAVYVVPDARLPTMAGVSISTRFRIKFLFYRLWPFLFTAAAVVVLGAFL